MSLYSLVVKIFVLPYSLYFIKLLDLPREHHGECQAWQGRPESAGDVAHPEQEGDGGAEQADQPEYQHVVQQPGVVFQTRN